VIHSHQYKGPLNPRNYHDKRVLVVGIGNSAVDIADELSRCSQQVYLATRTGAWVIPKFIQGKSVDHIMGFKRIFHFLLPSNLSITNKINTYMLEKAVSQQQGDMQNWGIKPSIHINQAHPTVSQELLNRIGNGTIRAKKGSIKHFGEHSVTFDDDYTISNLDEIILCTGYYITIPYLDKGLIDISEDNDLDLYKNVFSPSLPPTISVIGLVQPFGAIMPIAELQARWFCSVLKGEIGLPSVENMMKDIEERRNKLKQRYIHSPRHTVQVDPWDYNEFIARVIGAKPSILKNLAL